MKYFIKLQQNCQETNNKKRIKLYSSAIVYAGLANKQTTDAVFNLSVFREEKENEKDRELTG